MENKEKLCAKFGRILKADTSEIVNGVCFNTRMRQDIRGTILGRPTRSGVVFLMAFSFEDLDCDGNALNLGEFVFTEPEVERFIDAISRNDIKITAVHNHWLFEEPRLIYIHWEAIMPPLEFASISSDAIDRALRSHC